ncbi:carboxypeptidase regulatory-like domain-containing protein [Syntrophomonas palmitatica]|uniref:carboxypeptidase regulatory-like domain-containing protein n=1 Tax=Syntrophomonas palmitatica TaxID=402877 RepID=UPI0006CF81CF|nr:carboxypeptidase regulatory-like domain-containing protein [Syntrophomonas palmitatica]
MTVNLTSPGWVYAGCKSSDLDGNPVTASISFQLPLEGGSGSGVVSLAGTTVTASVYSKNALSDWTINLKPAQAISVKSGDKLSLQAAGTMFHVVNQAVCVTDTVTGLELSPQCVYTDGKPDTLEIIFNNTAAVTIPATGVALKICNVVNPGSEQGAVCTTTPVVKLTTAQNSGQTNAPQLSFTDSTLSLVLSKTVITVNPEGKVLDGPLCVTVKLNDSAGNPLNLNKQVKIRVKNAATTSLNGIAGSNAWNNLSLAAGTGSFNIDQIKDSAVAEGSFTRTIEARLADNPFVTSEADLKVTYLNTCKISGKIVDKETNQPVPGARIEVRDSQDKILALFYSGGDGSFATVVQAGSSGSLAISKEDYATEYFSYSSADAAGNAFAMGTVKIEPYAFKIDISYGYSAATQTGPAAPIAPDNGYGPYSDPYIQKGSIKLYPDQRNGVTCYFRSGKGVARGDTVNVVLPSKTNGMLNLTRSLTIGADYGIENKVEFVDVEKGFAVIMAADNPAASQGENLVGRIYQTDNEPVFELKPGQVFTYGKKPGNWRMVAMT